MMDVIHTISHPDSSWFILIGLVVQLIGLILCVSAWLQAPKE